MPILSEGQSIRGTYEVERLLGEGAFAEVYRVRHRFLGRQAMKVIKTPGLALCEVEDMLDEAVLLSRVGHPNLIRVFDANVLEAASGIFGFFTMEYVAGGSLDRFWRSHGPTFVPVETAVDLMLQVSRGMRVAHAESPPVVHRDIKPQNILVGYEADGLRARVADFGLAKAVNPLTLLATAAGTLAFKSPETFSRPKADSCAGDVWAIGATLYLLLTDKLPFEIDPELGWGNERAFDCELAPPSSWNPDVDATLDRIVLRCLQRVPTARYQHAGELLDALAAWMPQPCGPSPKDKQRSSFLTTSKAALGVHSPLHEKEGNDLVRAAFHKAQEQGRLLEAADLMEEAFNKWSLLRQKHGEQVRLWRRGISM